MKTNSQRWTTLLLAIALVTMFPAMASADPVRVFWTNGWQNGQGYPGTVNRVNRDGTGASLLVAGLQTVGDIEVDAGNGNLYYNQWTRPTNGGFGDASEGLYRSDVNGVGAALFSSANNATCSGFASGSHGIALDLVNGVVYFTRGVSYADCNGPELSKINFDGTGYTQLNGPGQDGWFLEGVDVDSANGKVYWGSPGVIPGTLDGAVNVVNTDGTAAAQLVGHTDGLGRAIALDPATGTIFFTASAIFDPTSGGQIWSVQTDGTGLTQLPIAGLTGVPDIEVDSAAQRIWFTDFGSGTIQSANYDGTGVVIEFAGLDFPLGLALEFVTDADGDGVNDDDDLCPDTAPGDPVDANGCSDAQVDGDGDGVCDPGAPSNGPSMCVGSDECAGTAIPEAVPTVKLGTNRWALVDDDFNFDTTKVKKRSFTTADTAGCSCEQIIAVCGYGKGHTKHGCSNSVMDWWTGLFDQAGEPALQCHVD